MSTTLGYDVVAAEVHRKALENVTKEMAVSLVRTCGSAIVTEAKDFSTCLLDTKPEHISFMTHVIFHLASSLIGTQAIAEFTRNETIRPGDGWIVNDPHTAGAMHQGDVSIIMPTFYKNEHVGWSFADMHVTDIGGVGVSAFAPGARDVYQEGLRFPPVRIIRDGVMDSQWETFIAANVRASDEVLNDIRSMIAANNTASTKLVDVLDEFGLERHRQFSEINKDLSERLLRDRISRIPDGVYQALDWNEFDGHDGPDQLLELSLKLHVRGSELHFEYAGVPQIDAYINSTQGAMWGQTMSGLLTVLGYGDLPLNGGVWRPLSFDLGPQGTIVNSVPPAPVSNAHSEVGLRVSKMVKECLSQALSLSNDDELRGRVAGQGQDGYPANATFGPNQHGGHSVMFYTDNAVGEGGGAQTIGDGQDAYGCTCLTGCSMADVETHEASDPVLFLWRRIVPNSGGPGEYRGGQGLEQAYTLTGDGKASGPAFNACAEVPPRGFGGGFTASTGNFSVLRNTNVAQLLQQGRLPSRTSVIGDAPRLASKITYLTLEKNDVWLATSGGGGGLGDPLLRDPERVREDIAAGYVTERHAAAAYGVILKEGAVDSAGTEQARNAIRSGRIDARPSAEQQRASNGVGTGVTMSSDGLWTCGYCTASLGTGNWRNHASVKESRVSERYRELDMNVRLRLEEPDVLLREYFCSECAGALTVEVVTSDTGMLPEAIVEG
ncbi:Acetone carboxylase alpha subunit [Rhodococcus fascians]|uniref:hydantoinase B/oxoprolinase family protein n=1 Tax=Rhodococcoides fascians TaxID=1828 RepID=UPI001427BE32|nr:Acetone carboxylase alpha subunit [Rhodococcus fascians]